MSLNRTSLDAEVLILRRMYAMSTANIPVSTNYILGTGPNGLAYFQDTIKNISSYGIDLPYTISTLYGQISTITLSGGVTLYQFNSTISGVFDYVNTQDAALSSMMSTNVSQLYSTISSLYVSSAVSQAVFGSTISGVYQTISGLSTSQGIAISTNYATLSGQIQAISTYNSAFSTSTAASLSTLSQRISDNTTNISTVNNYLDMRISSLSATVDANYSTLSSYINSAIVSSAADQLSSFSTQINNALISTASSLTNSITTLSGVVYTLSGQVYTNTGDIQLLSTMISTNYASTTSMITSTTQGIYNNPYFLSTMTISGSLSVSGDIHADNYSTFTSVAYIGTLSTATADLSGIRLKVNHDYTKAFGPAENPSRAIIYDLATAPTTAKGTLGLYDINNQNVSTNTGSSIIFGGLHTDDKLWYRAKISAVAPPTADASGIYGAGDMVFTTKENNNTTTMTDKMRIMHNGNVIIGQASTTTYKLDVAGSVNVSTTLYTSSIVVTGGIESPLTYKVADYDLGGTPRIIPYSTSVTLSGVTFTNPLLYSTMEVHLNVYGKMFPTSTVATRLSTAGYYSYTFVDGTGAGGISYSAQLGNIQKQVYVDASNEFPPISQYLFDSERTILPSYTVLAGPLSTITVRPSVYQTINTFSTTTDGFVIYKYKLYARPVKEL